MTKIVQEVKCWRSRMIYIINTIYLSRDTINIYYRAYPFNNTWNGDY